MLPNACQIEADLPAAEASTTGHHSAAQESSEQLLVSPLSFSQQPTPLASAQGSGASPFSHASAQAAFSDNLDTSMPAPTTPTAPSGPNQPGSIPHHRPEAHQPFGPSADSPFEHSDEQDNLAAAQTSIQSEGGAGNAVPQASSSSGVDATGSGHNPSDAQVRNSLTAASQPLPPESTVDIDAGVVDDGHMTISSGSALAEAVQSENATAFSQGRSQKSLSAGQSFADELFPVVQTHNAESDTQSDMFSGLHVESKGAAD